MIPTSPYPDRYACSASSPSTSPPVSPSLERHMLEGTPQQSQGSSSNSSKKKRLYRCNYCEKSFTKPSALQPHIYTHTGEKPFVCHIPGCNRGFAVISNLRRHFKVHEPKANDTSRMTPQERVMRVYRLATLSQETTQDNAVPYEQQQHLSSSSSAINPPRAPTSSLPFISTASSPAPSSSSAIAAAVPSYHHLHHHQGSGIAAKDAPFSTPPPATCSALIQPGGVLNHNPYKRP